MDCSLSSLLALSTPGEAKLEAARRLELVARRMLQDRFSITFGCGLSLLRIAIPVLNKGELSQEILDLQQEMQPYVAVQESSPGSAGMAASPSHGGVRVGDHHGRARFLPALPRPVRRCPFGDRRTDPTATLMSRRRGTGEATTLLLASEVACKL